MFRRILFASCLIMLLASFGLKIVYAETSLISGYDLSEWSGSNKIIFNLEMAYGESFTNLRDPKNISYATFYLMKEGKPKGSIYARLYAFNGLYPTYSENPLAVSNPVDMDNLSIWSLVRFDFKKGYVLEKDVSYCLMVGYVEGSIDQINFLRIGDDNTNPNFYGLEISKIGGYWSYSASTDLVFSVYGSGLEREIVADWWLDFIKWEWDLLHVLVVILIIVLILDLMIGR